MEFSINATVSALDSNLKAPCLPRDDNATCPNAWYTVMAIAITIVVVITLVAIFVSKCA